MQRAVGVDEDLLHRILAAPVGKDSRAVPQELSLVSRDDRLERTIVPGSRQVDKPRVTLRLEQRSARKSRRLQ